MDTLIPSTDSHSILAWCIHHGFDANFASKLVAPNIGIKVSSELANLSAQDVQLITRLCALNIGDRIRFEKAIKGLQDQGVPNKGESSLPSKRVLSGPELDNQSTVAVSLHFDVFDDDFDVEDPNLPDIHTAVKLGLGCKWDEDVHGLMVNQIKNHLKKSENVRTFMAHNKCSPNVIGAVLYYSCDARQFCGEVTSSIYKMINPLLAKRNKTALKPWQPFLYYLCCSEDKLPTVQKPRVYRGITVALPSVSSQYQQGNDVVWPAFTSVSTKQKKVSDFTNDGKGTFLVIDAIDAKDISPISLFPDEHEGLLYPNSTFAVVEVQVVGTHTTVRLRQLETPQEFKPLRILERKQAKFKQIKMLYPLAFSSGDADSLFKLGLLYYFGKDEMLKEGEISKDFGKSFKYFSLAAAKGHPGAELAIGKMYLKGLGDVPQDFEKGIGYCNLAANKGNPKAQIFLGKLYCRGLQVDQPCQADKTCVLESLRFELPGVLCYRAMKADREYMNEAVRYFELAQKDHQAQFYLGQFYFKGPLQDHEKSIKYFLQAAEGNLSMSQNNLAILYFISTKKDSNEVAKYFTLSARQGNSYAQNNLGWLYLLGKGVPQNTKEAIRLFALSAAQGNSYGQYSLGCLYKTGTGVKTNYGKAVEYFTHSALQGNSYGQYLLGMMWDVGFGVKPNDKRAKKVLRSVRQAG